MTLLALDVGSKRIGVAVSDPSESFAMPLEVVECTNQRADIERIVEIAREREATELVVGDPVRLTGERALASDKVDRFIATLGRRFPGKIHLVDERLTTAQATRQLIEADVSRAERKRVVDKLAATLILENFLTRRRRASHG